MTTENEESVASKMVQLLVTYPLAGEDSKGFELHIPRVISEQSYQIIVQHIEFRRKCMNQGFDNLRELLQMHWEALQKASGSKTEDETIGSK